eukprot:5521425-Pleurochrysis_carterae.AAC.1
MNVALARALSEGGKREGGGGSRVVDGGRVADGPGLTPYLRDAVETARAQPPGFASFRNLAPAEVADLA